MDNLVFNKSKGEVFKCKLEVDGANPRDIEARLCMSFPGQPSIFFPGKLNESGDCTFTIPKLSFVNAAHGKMHIEAIADETYFKVFEADFSFKSSVNVKVNEASISPQEVEPKIRVKKVARQEATTETPLKTGPKRPDWDSPPVNENTKDGWSPIDVEGVFNKPKPQPEPQDQPKEGGRFKTFSEYWADKKR